jgi:hypothetical protein
MYSEEWYLTSNNSLMGRVSTGDHECDALSSYITQLISVRSDIWSHHRTARLRPDQGLRHVCPTC